LFRRISPKVLDVLSDTNAVTQTHRVSINQRATNALNTISLTGVNRDREHLASQQIKSILHPRCREACFRARYIEPNSTLVSVAQRELRYLETAV
jgi:hypothetical protein